MFAFRGEYLRIASSRCLWQSERMCRSVILSWLPPSEFQVRRASHQRTSVESTARFGRPRSLEVSVLRARVAAGSAISWAVAGAGRNEVGCFRSREGVNRAALLSRPVGSARLARWWSAVGASVVGLVLFGLGRRVGGTA
jgi:hypothetical protein